MPNSASSRTSTGGITGVKPFSSSRVSDPLHQRQLEPHERSLQERRSASRPRARRPPCPPNRRAARGGRAPWPPPRRPRAAPRPRRARSGPPGWAARPGRPSASTPGRAARRRAPSRASEAPRHLLDRRRGVLARALQLADLLGGLVLRSPQLLELRQHGAPALVQLRAPRRAERGPPRGAQRVTSGLRVLADLAEVEHGRSGWPPGPTRSRPRRRSPCPSTPRGSRRSGPPPCRPRCSPA